MRILIALLLSLFSTIVMSYIALAASIGPFIETTLVLCSMFFFQIFFKKMTTSDYVSSVGLTTAAGGIGGIIATGLAFSLPTLYFLSDEIFRSWMQNPLFFTSVVSAFCFISGGYGLLFADFFEHKLLIKEQMKFPIGELVYNAIAAPGQLRKSLELACGFFGTQLLLLIHVLTSFVGSSVVLLNRFSWSLITLPSIVIPLNQLPMYMAVGFVTGHVIAIPLVVGFLAKVLCVDPLFYIYTHASILQTSFLAPYINQGLTNAEFILAFCSGMVLYGSFVGFFDLFASLFKAGRKISKSVRHSIRLRWSVEKRFTTMAWIQAGATVLVTLIFLNYYIFSSIQYFLLMGLVALCIFTMVALGTRMGVLSFWGYFPVVRLLSLNGMFMTLSHWFKDLQETTFIKKHKGTVSFGQAALVLCSSMLFFYYFNFTFTQQLYLLICTGICIYQMLIIAGRMGIIPLGRFATFVMVPGMFLFNFDFIQVTLVAAFVEIAGGVAGDALFGRRLAMLAHIKRNRIIGYQWLGLIICSLTIGVIFWLFIHVIGLGQEGLPATKAASRALLISFKSFDWFVLLSGFVFGYFMKYVKVNPALLLGGILMPPTISIMLIAGGLLTYVTKDKERYYPILSGVSAGNSIWMLAQALLKVV